MPKVATLKPRLSTLDVRQGTPLREGATGNAEPWREGLTTSDRGYGYPWQKARATFLKNNPCCAMCREEGRIAPAAVVDHKTPHRGDQKLFWDTSNWQSLCKLHHDSHKQSQDRANPG